MFIYKITNKINNKVYIGQTRKKTVNDRWGSHTSSLKRGTHYNSHLQASWDKYGSESFEFEIVAVASSNEELDSLEKSLISEFNSVNGKFGYNKDHGGSSGKQITEETRQKISVSSSGSNNNMYGRCGPLAPAFGKKGELSPNFGKKHPPEFGAAISERLSGELHPLFGVAMSEETKQRISEGNKGKEPWNRGIPRTDEEKAKMSASKMGKKLKPFTDEHKAKMRESALKREQRKREQKNKEL